MSDNTRALNLTKTQKGYWPLGDRFKSFVKDDQKSPVTDQMFYYNNYANQTLEHADLALLYPTPEWLRVKLQNKRHPQLATRLTANGSTRVTSNGDVRILV